MAVMIEKRTLRGKPEDGAAGPSLGVEVQSGAKIEVLGTLPPVFVEIKVLDLPGQPRGWVTESAIDQQADLLPPIAGSNLAEVANLHAQIFGVNAHFLVAYAHMRSGFKPGDFAGGTEKGPYGLSPAEWVFFGDRPDLGVEFPAEAIDEWRSQSLVSALRLMIVQNLLTDAISRAPTWAEIVLALMCGPALAVEAIKTPDKKIGDILTAAAAKAFGVDLQSFQARFSDFIDDRTAADAIEVIAAKFQTSADQTRTLVEALVQDDGSEESTVGAADDPAGRAGGAGTGKIIDISATDIDALARVATSEVGHFLKYGQLQLDGGLAAVVDTIFNRVAHVSFPDSIQRVIDQPKQFSAINGIHTWTRLPPAPLPIFDFVKQHVTARVDGAASIIDGATHFLNPFFASKSSMRSWGQFVVDHAVASFGNAAKEDVHYHGTAPGGGDPREYVLVMNGKSFQFTPVGKPVARVAGGRTTSSFSATGASRATTFRQRLIENTLSELHFFEQGVRQEGDDPQFRRIGAYWQSVGEDFDGRTLIPGPRPGTLINPAWSAAFISYIVRISGGGDRFLYAQAHAIYVQDFVAGRLDGLYEAVRPEAHPPQIGDLIHAGREGAKRFDFDAARQAFKADKRYASHSDVVVEVRREENVLIAIGGNVSQSVSVKRIKLNADGTLKTRRDSAGPLPWIAVLRCVE